MEAVPLGTDYGDQPAVRDNKTVEEGRSAVG